MNRARGGRPPLPASRRRRKAVWLKLSPDELETLRARAREANRPVHQFLREAGLGKPLPAPVPAIHRSLWQDLGRVGGNLNQIAARLNRGESVSVHAIEPTLAELRALLTSVRQQLLGRPA